MNKRVKSKFLKYFLMAFFILGVLVGLVIASAWVYFVYMSPDNPRNWPKDTFSRERWTQKEERYKVYHDLLNSTNKFTGKKREEVRVLLGEPDYILENSIFSDGRYEVFEYFLKDGEWPMYIDKWLYLRINSDGVVHDCYLAID